SGHPEERRDVGAEPDPELLPGGRVTVLVGDRIDSVLVDRERLVELSHVPLSGCRQRHAPPPKDVVASNIPEAVCPDEVNAGARAAMPTAGDSRAAGSAGYAI